MAGYNPIYWKCDEWGCWNVKCRPKLEMLHNCFPGKINYGDNDGLVEINGYLNFLEWKKPGGELQTGQRILFERITKRTYGDIAFIVEGEPDTMEVYSYQYFFNGKQADWVDATLDDVMARIKSWADKASKGF
tara:strand:+ start:152 stop:550 length:399 start_codon:yes stop_codon:yes gene_type:complete